MTDLREALEYWEGLMHVDSMPEGKFEPKPLAPVVVAARRFLALTETGERVNWCETHLAQSSSGSVEPDRCGWDRFVGGECSIVPKFLADYLTEEE